MGIPITFVTTNSWQIVFIIYSIMVSSSSVNHGMGREEWLAILEWHIAMIVSKTGGGTPYFTILYVTIQSWLYYVNSASSWMKRFLWVTHSGRREEWWNILFNGSSEKRNLCFVANYRPATNQKATFVWIYSSSLPGAKPIGYPDLTIYSIGLSISHGLGKSQTEGKGTEEEPLA